MVAVAVIAAAMAAIAIPAVAAKKEWGAQSGTPDLFESDYLPVNS